MKQADVELSSKDYRQKLVDLLKKKKENLLFGNKNKLKTYFLPEELSHYFKVKDAEQKTNIYSKLLETLKKEIKEQDKHPNTVFYSNFSDIVSVLTDAILLDIFQENIFDLDFVIHRREIIQAFQDPKISFTTSAYNDLKEQGYNVKLENNILEVEYKEDIYFFTYSIKDNEIIQATLDSVELDNKKPQSVGEYLLSIISSVAYYLGIEKLDISKFDFVPFVSKQENEKSLITDFLNIFNYTQDTFDLMDKSNILVNGMADEENLIVSPNLVVRKQDSTTSLFFEIPDVLNMEVSKLNEDKIKDMWFTIYNALENL